MTHWEKEAARRGYWYRKVKKVTLIQAFEITLLKHDLQLYRFVNQLHTNSVEEMKELQRNRDAFRNKYLNYVRKFNEAEKVIDIIKQENAAFKQENITVKQEIDELTNLLEPMRRSLNKTTKKLRDIKQENEDLYLMLEPVLGITNILPRDDFEQDDSDDNTPKESELNTDDENISKDSDTDRDDNTPKESKQVTNRDNNIPQTRVQDTDRVEYIPEESDNLNQIPTVDTTSNKPNIDKFKRKKRKSIDKRKPGKRTRKV